MCRLFLQHSSSPLSAEGWLVGYHNSLFLQSLHDSTGRPNADGWGIAYLDQDNRWHVRKSDIPASHDPYYKLAAQEVVSTCILGHIRRGSVGHVSISNSHPFHFGDWVFAHNGNIPDFTRLREVFLRQIDPDLQPYIQGETDSEHLFYLFLSDIRTYHPVHDRYQILSVLGEVASGILETEDIKDPSYLALTFMLSAPGITFGLRFNRSLYYFHDLDKILVASEPIKDYNIWREIPERTLFILYENRLELVPLLQIKKIKV